MRNLLVAALLVSAFLAGCSGGTDDSSSSTDAATGTPTSSTGATTPASGSSTTTTSTTGSSTTSTSTTSSGSTTSKSSTTTTTSTTQGGTTGPGKPTPVSATCALSVTGGVYAGGSGGGVNDVTSCVSGNLISSTGAKFTSGSVKLEFTGAAVSVTFKVLDAAGTELGTVTGGASPLTVDLADAVLPDGASFELTAKVSFTGPVANFSGTSTFSVA